MTNLRFPAYMPQPLIDGYQEQMQDSRYVFQNEAGTPSYRRKSTAYIKEISMTFMVGHKEKILFEDWFNVETQGGVLEFLMRNPIDSSDDVFQFIGMPMFVPVTGRYWKISIMVLNKK